MTEVDFIKYKKIVAKQLRKNKYKEAITLLTNMWVEDDSPSRRGQISGMIFILDILENK